MNDIPKTRLDDVPLNALPGLRNAIVDAYDVNDLAEKVLDFGRDFNGIVPAAASFEDQVLTLLRQFRRENLLGALLEALIAGRAENAAFQEKLRAAVADARQAAPQGLLGGNQAGIADDDVQPSEDGRRRFGGSQRLVLVAGLLVAGASAAAFSIGRYVAPALPDAGDLILHLRQSDDEDAAMGGLYVKYHSKSLGPEQLAKEPVRAEYHIAIDDIASRSSLTFEPNPDSADGGQGVVSCAPDCFQIKKMAYEDPKVLFVYLKELQR